MFSLQRQDQAITLDWKVGVFGSVRNDLFSMPNVPWQDLGYGYPMRMSGASSWTLFSGPPFLWLTGIGVLVLLRVARRRARKRQKNRSLAG